jgi:DNA polymerase elongation subunit (family B)
MSKKLKILIYDIETEPHVGYCWGKWEQNILSFQTYGGLLSVAYKWLGEKEVHCIARPDFKDKTDKSLVKALHNLFDQADIVIAHNGDAFDQKMSNVRFINAGLTPPKPYVSIDTKKVAKKYFRFVSNSLNDLGKFLGLGTKTSHTGFQMWLDCMAGKKEAWKLMIKYNKQDVVLLEKVYLKLLPWIDNHPNVAAEFTQIHTCPKCGSNKLKSCGIRRTKTASYRNYRCLSCFGYTKSRKAEKVPGPEVV